MDLGTLKVELKPDHAVTEASCKEATGKSLAEWFKALDKHGGIPLGRRELSKWVEREHEVSLWWATTIVNEYEVARGDLAKDGKPKGYSICPTKNIAASPKRCFEAFASAAALDAWFGPRNKLELQEGGTWTCADGNLATIRKVTEGKSIRLLAADAGLTMPIPVEIKFTPNGTKCTVMVATERLQSRAEADGYRRGWGNALDRLKAAIEPPRKEK